ncbi:MAG: universal stress protein [Elusimicrobiota bacterium]|nr:universal stress protein [Elusimicrobiota bacterium]
MIRFPPRRILAAVDLTPASAPSWRAATELAARFDATLDAVYCEPPLGPEVEAYGAVARLDAVRGALARLRRRLGPGARLHVVRGEPAPVLARLARERRYDLLVMGTHRRRGLSRLLAPSVAGAVARDCGCPVLVVPRYRAIRRVLAPVNEADYARRGLLAAGLVARAFKARLSVLTVVTDPVFGASPARLLRERIAELPEAVRRDARPESKVAREGPVADILRSTKGHDLVVLAAHRKSLLGDWVLGTTVERVLRHSPVPVLSVPSDARRRSTIII